MTTSEFLERAGKANGPNRDCYNIVRENGWRGWYNLGSLEEISVTPDDQEVTILFCNDVSEQIKEKEMQKYMYILEVCDRELFFQN